MPATFPFEDEYFDVLSKARNGLGLELDELADLSGVKPSEIQAMEGGGRKPDPDKLARLAGPLGLAPARLVELALRPSPPAEVDLPELSFFLPPAGSFAANSFIFSCRRTLACAIVDPGSGPEAICRIVEKNRLRPACILVTHGHGDHLGALAQLASRYRLRAVALENERPLLGGYPADFVESGHSLRVGEIHASLHEIPGHTPGGAAISVAPLNLAFSGDSLFARSAGRCRGPAETYRRYIRAVRKALLELPPATVICPGHGPLTRVRDELELNPFFP